MRPVFANSLHVFMTKGTMPGSGETTIEFKHVYRENSNKNTNDGVIPGETNNLNSETVSSIVMNREMAYVLRDSLNNLLTKLEIEENTQHNG